MPPIGTNTLNTLTRHYILPQITDNVYTGNNALLYRLIRGNKKMVQGGTHIEIPLLSKRSAGTSGTFAGLQELAIGMHDPIQAAYVDWKFHYATMAIDYQTMVQSDSSLSIANTLNVQGEIAYMEMAENLAAGVMGTSDPLDLDGLRDILSTSNTYAGIDRSASANAWFRAKIDSSTNALTFAAMRGLISTATYGGTHPTIWFANATNYNRIYALGLSTTGYSGIDHPRQPGGHDELLLQAGFTNLLHENIPVVQDDNLDDDELFALNENHLKLVVSPLGDFRVEPWQKPVNQMGYVSTIVWAGNLICTAPRTQAALTALSS